MQKLEEMEVLENLKGTEPKPDPPSTLSFWRGLKRPHQAQGVSADVLEFHPALKTG